MSTTKDLQKWSDSFMFKAEESNAAEGTKAYLLGGPTDPLGQIAACCKMYKGEVVRDLRDVTDAEREEYLREIQKTVLAMPLEAVNLHFMLEGVTRSITHQIVRQRTAAYAQESMRFAVKEDMATAVALPPSLENTLSLEDLVQKDLAQRLSFGLINGEDEAWLSDHRAGVRERALSDGGAQKWRIRWDESLANNSEAYLEMINDGMPAEDARGMSWHNVTTRMNYITNLRNWYDTMSKRVSDQAQFEWRVLAMQMALAMREFGKSAEYEVRLTQEDIDNRVEMWDPRTDRDRVDPRIDKVGDVVTRSSYWQYEALSNELKPIDFKLGRRAFAANFDRPSRIGERIDAFALSGVPSDKWTTGSPEHGIPPIHPEEWLLDPNSARLDSGMEFDIFGNRVAKGTGWHWTADEGGHLVRQHPSDPSLTQHMYWPGDFDGSEV